jgi:hypothetical protein
MVTPIRRVTIAALLALTFSACGGTADDSASIEAEGAADSDSDGASTSDDSSGSEGTGGIAEGDEPDDNATIVTVGDVPGVSEECEAIANFVGATGQLLSGQLDPVEGRAIIDQFVTSVDEEIRATAQVVADYTISILEIIEETGSVEAAFSSPEGMAAMAAISTPEYTEATSTLTDYVGECSLGG